MRIRNALKNIMCVSLASSLVCISSCSKTEDEFPEMDFDETQVAESSEVQVEETELDYIENYHEISVALPYSDETINRVAKLFYLENTSFNPRMLNGRDISLDYLDSVDIPYIIHSVSIPNEGIGINTMAQYRNTSTVPDIYLTYDIDSIVESGFALPIDNYAGDIVFDNNGIYANALLQDSVDGNTYGLPLYQSVMMIYGSSQYIPSSGQLPWRTTTSQLRNYLNNINSEFDVEELDVIPFADASQMIPYLTSAYNEDIPTPYGCLGVDNKQPLIDGVTFVSNQYRNGNSADYNEDGSDPRVTRNVGLWMDSSADVLRWSQYYPNGLYFTSLPTASSHSNITPYASVYSVCISNSCHDVEFAADFMTYICLDEDAQMLLTRLEPKPGFLPVVKSSYVWDMVCGEDVFGGQAALYKDYIGDAVYCPAPGSRVQTNVSDYCSDYINSIDTEDSFDFSPEDMG